MIRGGLLASVLAGFTTHAAAQDVAPEYDPLAGIDPDGRIERPELPGDLANPDRWRYTPPGRIAPGSWLERFFVSSFISPVLFRDEDVGTGGGIAVTDIDFRNQDYREFANILLTYSTEGQQNYSIFWRRWLHHRKLPNGGIVREERSSVFGGAGYSKTLTRRFFGRGSRTREGDETSYTEELSAVGFGLQLSVPDPGDDVIATAGVNYQHHDLASGRVSGVPSTETSFPAVFADGDGVDQLWVGLGLAYDGRDSVHQPFRGGRIGFHSQTAVLQTGGEFGGTLGVDGQYVLKVPSLFHRGGHGQEEHPPTDVIALGVEVADTFGDLPFYSLPSLGGSHSLRGFIDNRFVDRAAFSASFEYRFGIVARGFAITERIRIERIGLGLFYDLGTVAEGLESLHDARMHDSVGAGLRISFAREALFRVDLGFSDEGSNLSLRYGNAF